MTITTAAGRSSRPVVDSMLRKCFSFFWLAGLVHALVPVAAVIDVLRVAVLAPAAAAGVDASPGPVKVAASLLRLILSMAFATTAVLFLLPAAAAVMVAFLVLFGG